jgi:hypothetical protein
MSRHTPGPWQALDASEVGAIFINSGEGPVADIYAKDAWWSDSEKADARLIAAAPDLLEALSEMLESFSMDNVGANAMARNINAKKSARAAIHKAVGGGVR